MLFTLNPDKLMFGANLSEVIELFEKSIVSSLLQYKNPPSSDLSIPLDMSTAKP